MRTPLLSLLTLLALGIAGPAWAQEPEAPPMYWVLQDYVAPSNVQAYEVAAKELVDLGVAVIGGCCGTTPEHIRALRRMVDSFS